jgi:hypothetical protein
MSGYKFGQKNFYELLSNFSNVTVFGSLDSYGQRSEYIREGTVWSDVENSREILKKYSNIQFVIQSVITNLNLWSLPDFHQDWYNKGLVEKANIRYFCLNTPEYLHISVLDQKMKEKILLKYEQYLNFLKEETSTLYNAMTPLLKVKQILEAMLESPKVPVSMLQFALLKKDLKQNLKFKDIFPEFKV